eukprot:4006504-Pyramimonas_sp.AAC.1
MVCGPVRSGWDALGRDQAASRSHRAQIRGRCSSSSRRKASSLSFLTVRSSTSGSSLTRKLKLLSIWPQRKRPYL